MYILYHYMYMLSYIKKSASSIPIVLYEMDLHPDSAWSESLICYPMIPNDKCRSHRNGTDIRLKDIKTLN